MKKPISLLLENLRGKSAERNLIEIAECHLYTDTNLSGQIIIKDSPYQILNSGVFDNENVMLPKLIFRFENYLPKLELPTKPLKESKEKIETDSFLESNIGEQMAVLISLILGIRLKAGVINRIYNPLGSPLLGDLKYYLIKNDPKPIRFISDKLILPNAIRKSISLKICNKYIKKLSYFADRSELFNSLLYSAKLYRDSLWIIESDVSLSWIMLVSAIETAAQCKFSKELKGQKNFEIIKNLNPDLAEKIKNNCKKKGKEIIAKEFIDKRCATKKFIKFIKIYLPEPPEKRPAKAFQFGWDWKNLKASLKKIYTYRSEALHGGKGFPDDMCNPAPIFNSRLYEKPLEPIRMNPLEFHHIKNSSPMFIHIFEYIVRNCLLNWWDSLEEEPS